MLCELEHLAFDLEVREFVEGVLGGANLVVEIERGGDQSLAVRPNEDGADAAEKDGASNGGDLCRLHPVAQQHEGIGAHLVGRQVIGLVEIDVIDLVAGNEGIDLHGLVAVWNRSRNLVRFQDDILAVLDLVALHLLVALDGIACLAVNELALHPVAGLAVQRVESDPLRRRGGGVERHRAGHLPELDEAFPIRTRCDHDAELPTQPMQFKRIEM